MKTFQNEYMLKGCENYAKAIIKHFLKARNKLPLWIKL
jgi:hypothetical protein